MLEISGFDNKMEIVSKQEVYDAFRAWCEKKGIRYIPAMVPFYMDLKHHIPEYRERQKRSGTKERERVIIGIKLLTNTDF